jgi:hypothetical protein
MHTGGKEHRKYSKLGLIFPISFSLVTPSPRQFGQKNPNFKNKPSAKLFYWSNPFLQRHRARRGISICGAFCCGVAQLPC